MLEVNKLYNFEVVKTGRNIEKDYNYSHLSCAETDKIVFFPFGLEVGKIYELKVIRFTDREQPILSMKHLLVRNYTNGSYYKFDILGIRGKDSNESNLICIEVRDSLGVKREVDGYKWQIGEKIKGEKLTGKVLIKDHNKLLIEQDLGKLTHPKFEIDGVYDFKVVDFQTFENDTRAEMHLRGEDNNIYKIQAHFFQTKQIIGENVKCIYKGISPYGNATLKQLNDNFQSFGDIFGEDEDFYLKVKNEIKSNFNEIYLEIHGQYNERENLWILSFCKGCEKLINLYLSRYDYKNAISIIDALIYCEKWIIKSGFLKTFNTDNRNEAKVVAKNKINRFSFLKESLRLLVNKTAIQFIEDFLDSINYEIKLSDYEDKLGRCADIIQYTPYEWVDSSFIHDIFNKLEKYELLGAKEYSLFLPAIKKRYSLLRKKFFTDELPIYKKNFDLAVVDELSKILYLNGYIDYRSGKNPSALRKYSQYLRISANKLTDQNERKKYIRYSINLLLTSVDYIKEFNSEIYEGKLTPHDFIKEELFKYDETHYRDLLDSISKDIKINVQIADISKSYIRVKYYDFTGFIPVNSINGFLFSDTLFNGIDVYIQSVDDKSKLFSACLDKGYEEAKNNKDSFSIEKRLHNKLSVGDEVLGLVKNIEDDIGVFLNFGLIDGLITKHNIKYDRDVRPSDLFKEGQVIKCKYTHSTIDQEKRDAKFYFSTTDYYQDPWDKYEKNLKQQSWYVGKVVNITDFGAFIDIAPSLTGLLHISHLNSNNDIYDVFSNEDTYNVYADKIDRNEKNISFTNFRPISNKDFYNNEVLNLWRETSNKDKNLMFVDSLSHIDKEVFFQVAYSFMGLSHLSEDFSEKITNLEWSKFFFSLNRASKSYLTEFYIKYYELINEFAESEIGEENVVNVEKFIANIKDNKVINDVFPLIQDVLKSLEVISLYGKDDLNSLNKLIEISYDESLKSTNRKLARLVVLNNIIEAEDVPKEFYVNNKNSVIKYLRDGVLDLGYYEAEESLTEEEIELLNAIKKGESIRMEFKSTLYTPVLSQNDIEEVEKLKLEINRFKEKKNQKAIKAKENQIKSIKESVTSETIMLSAMKVIASFANTIGGTLLIGVKDDKQIIGVDKEIKEGILDKSDYYQKRFDNICEKFLSKNIYTCISDAQMIEIDGDNIFKVHVEQSSDPVYVKVDDNGKEVSEFFIRRAASVCPLDTKETIEYLSNRK